MDSGSLVLADGIEMRWSRDENARKTTYVLEIPWPQIGLTKIHRGKSIGIAVLVNDSDGPDTTRTYMPLFDGIAHAKNHKLFGRLTLR